MEQKTNQENQPAPAGKRKMSNFLKALLATAIPIVALSIVSVAGTFINNNIGFQAVWFVAAGVWVLAIIAAVVFAILHKNRVAAGIVAGIAIGMVSLGATCFAVIVATTR